MDVTPEPLDTATDGDGPQPWSRADRWFSEDDSTPDADRFVCHAADQQLVSDVQREGFEGTRWFGLSKELVAYGTQVVSWWLRSGRIFDMCWEKGFSVSGPPEGGISSVDVDALTEETVAFGITRFQNEVLATNKWDPGRGASLKTFFVGMCLKQFPTTYKTWLRERTKETRRQMAEHEAFRVTSDHQRPWRPEAVAQPLEDALQRYIPNQINRDIVRLRAENHSLAEISSCLGITEGSIESRLHRLRKDFGPGSGDV